MTEPARASLRATPPAPRSASGLEPLREPPSEIREALARDQTELQREVILSQRWLRLFAVLALAAASLSFTPEGRPVSVLPLVIVCAGYAICVFGAATAARRVAGLTSNALFPALLLTADLVAVAGIIYVSSPPGVSHRFLMLALMSVSLAAFYFGAGLGVYVTLLSAALYLLIARVLPPIVGGLPPVGPVTNAILFALVGGVLTYIFGSFRARMNELRKFCKTVEEGELSLPLELTRARFPDDLTLLARAFDSMRNGLAEQIGTDPLTGCMNRRALESRIRSDWRHAKRRGTQVAVVALDVDHFKQINDTRGHPVGDVVLQQLTGIMMGTARDTDAVSRFGGDEFVILLPDTGWQGALTFAERLRRRVDDFTFGPPGQPMAITISVGVALARGSDPLSPEELLKEADRSLYKAKQQGRNRVFA
jgi:diguanylate cyclase (GGDEF)-like protein